MDTHLVTIPCGYPEVIPALPRLGSQGWGPCLLVSGLVSEALASLRSLATVVEEPESALRAAPWGFQGLQLWGRGRAKHPLTVVPSLGLPLDPGR